ncbi:hypothetical protein TNCT_18591 [Trichonephila clavata]|uniref:Uncharacterized protein n=1 Tax=Trichonephila clavata TaxID=2740835 RepID=A0A8X6F9X9_TRICU|nr:hypothetical protein TNCT_18591 [Trichonephila clavata]
MQVRHPWDLTVNPFHFKPIPTDASPDNPTDENEIIPNVNSEGNEKKSIDTFNSNLAHTHTSLSNNSNSEMGFYNEAFHFTPTPTDASPVSRTEENVLSLLPKRKTFF